MIQQELELPQGWIKTSLEYILETLEAGKRPKGGVKQSVEGIPSLGGEHLNDQGGFRFKKIKFIPLEFFENILKGRIKLNDVLIVKDGATTGRLSFVGKDFPYPKSAVNEHVFIMRGYPSLVIQEFLFYYLFSLQGQQLIKNRGSGLIGGINTSFVEEFGIPICPLNEQKRIVSKIKELFSNIDSAKQSLEQTKLQLEQYRASLLKSKFLGKGTEKWKLCKLEDICQIVRGASPRPAHSPKYFGGKIPWITVGTLTSEPSPYFTHTVEFLNEEGKKKSRYILSDTLLITNSGATLGVPKISKINGCINDGVVALLKVDYPLKKLVYYFLTSKTKELRMLKQGAAQPNLNTTIIKNIEFLLPPLEEQEQILSQIEQGFSLIENTSQIVESTLQKLQTMKMSVLKQAFEGKLVPQDPNDEPASVLLERIKSTKESKSIKQRRVKNVKK